MAKYYVHIPLPPEMAVTVDAVKTAWQGESASAPHITLTKPARLENSTEEQLRAAFRHALRDVGQFPIRFTRLGRFGLYDILYMGVRRSRRLVRCRQVIMDVTEGLLDGVVGEFDHFPTPHVTLAKRLEHSADENFELWRQLQGFSLGKGFTCDKVNLLKREQEDPWEVIEQYSLRPARLGDILKGGIF